ncbi:MAG: hypothetical protein BRC39_05375 [Cyanobacteria bacterium QH_7_48_89]|nr:MAG: hypothetical protein BRC39_05375 [Cyanobacteria bacterium QH_7_48_89]
MKEFQLQGINHLALVCKDMARTVDFYTNTLGLDLIKTIALPGGGQHFFFDIGNGDALAFFWFPQAPEAAPSVASVSTDAFQTGDITTAHGSMNHVSFQVPLEKLEEYRENLLSKGIILHAIFNTNPLQQIVKLVTPKVSSEAKIPLLPKPTKQLSYRKP